MVPPENGVGVPLTSKPSIVTVPAAGPIRIAPDGPVDVITDSVAALPRASTPACAPFNVSTLVIEIVSG